MVTNPIVEESNHVQYDTGSNTLHSRSDWQFSTRSYILNSVRTGEIHVKIPLLTYCDLWVSPLLFFERITFQSNYMTTGLNQFFTLIANRLPDGLTIALSTSTGILLMLVGSSTFTTTTWNFPFMSCSRAQMYFGEVIVTVFKSILEVDIPVQIPTPNLKNLAVDIITLSISCTWTG